jgi:tetraacyldisaccharide 4'-kinase
VAVAGIADPSGFFRGLEAAGWTIVRELRYRDHHRYGAADVARIAGTARTSGARVILTTQQDLVRLLPFRPFGVPVASVPMTLEIDSPATLDEWLVQTCRGARGSQQRSTQITRNGIR